MAASHGGMGTILGCRWRRAVALHRHLGERHPAVASSLGMRVENEGSDRRDRSGRHVVHSAM